MGKYIIFLDVDGVLNHDSSYKLVTKDGLKKYIQIPGTYDKGIVTKKWLQGNRRSICGKSKANSRFTKKCSNHIIQ